MKSNPVTKLVLIYLFTVFLCLPGHLVLAKKAANQTDQELADYEKKILQSSKETEKKAVPASPKKSNRKKNTQAAAVTSVEATPDENQAADEKQDAKSESEVTEAESVQKEVPGKDVQMIDSLLNNSSFPEKSHFIADEDRKNPSESSAAQTLVSPALEPTKETKQQAKLFSVSALIGGTLGVGVLMIGLAYLFKKLKDKAFQMSPSSKKLKIIAQQAISLKSKILIIDALGKKYLIGATQDRIQLLADLDFYDNAENRQSELPDEESADFLDGIQGGSSFLNSAASNKNLNSEVPVKPRNKKSVFVPISESLNLAEQVQSQPAEESVKENLEKEVLVTQKVMGRIKDKLKELKKISSTH